MAEDYEDTVQHLASLDPEGKPDAEQVAILMAQEILALRKKNQELCMELLVALTESYGGYDLG